ncbi:MAG: hypothetical protein KGJ86_18240, partial [Chloroflexota bacterium]|nr:hypothetical protein [Chloroflexota bacterium]
WAIWLDGFAGAWSDPWRRGRQQQPPFDVHMIPPFAAHAGGKVGFNLNPGNLGALMLKKASPDRLKEELAVINWLCAPFGSKEMMLLEYGVEGPDYKMDAKGNPVLSDKSNPDANYVPWKFTAQHHSVLYLPDIPDFAKTLSDAEKVLIPIGVSNPTWGLIPGPTLDTKGAVLTQTTNSGIQDVLVGRRPLSDYDQIVNEWRKNGGDQIRKEFTDQLAAKK